MCTERASPDSLEHSRYSLSDAHSIHHESIVYHRQQELCVCVCVWGVILAGGYIPTLNMLRNSLVVGGWRDLVVRLRG